MRVRDAAALILANLIWGSSYAVARAALAILPSPVLAFLRCLLAGLLLAPFVRWKPVLPSSAGVGDAGTGVPSGWRGPALLAAIGASGFALPKLLLYYGLRDTTATEAAVIVNLEAVFTALLGAALLKERLERPAIAGIALAFAGAVALAWPAAGAAGGRHALGNLLVILSMLLEALATVLAVPAARRYSGLVVTASGSLWGALLLAPAAAAAWLSAPDPRAWLSPGCVAATLYLAVAVTIVAYSLLYQVLRRVEAGRAAVFLYLQPLVGALLGVFWLGEAVTLRAVVGAMLILAGVGLVILPRPKPVPPPVAP